jgi:hypothetical protein
MIKYLEHSGRFDTWSNNESKIDPSKIDAKQRLSLQDP